MNRLAAPLLLIVPLALSAAALLLPLAPLRGPDELARLILVELRLPRLLLGLGYGAVLGLTGAALQALFANPLASPDITGASSGAALGAVIGSTFLGVATPLAMGASGAAGAALSLLLLFAVAGRRPDAATLLLAGLAISLATGALTSLALALAPSPFAFYEAFDWLMGSLVDRSLGQAAAALVPAAVASALLVRHSGALDRLALGEDVAASMGVAPGRLRSEVVLLSAVAVGACVAVCGAVGFVGLIAPVLARRLTRGHPGRAMLPAALIGAMILVAADLLTRLAPLGRTIPLGVVTASLGTPIFLWVLLRMRGRLAS
ncbi:FecCD family ABC transporter permease [Sphingomonas glaciei]|uniref:Iron ABC transporter permease n=1 Tax=Sphingomonas glaciei TaxID=2938948 RepID=A0ABY5MWW1_9SPHN|nr:iron chelate uptake ABC transporter family permease subunit [Sphingomonas glaciei]UUR08602.1 iron ABC transporter permease [Sphingomonas glaciei]